MRRLLLAAAFLAQAVPGHATNYDGLGLDAFVVLGAFAATLALSYYLATTPRESRMAASRGQLGAALAAAVALGSLDYFYPRVVSGLLGLSLMGIVPGIVVAAMIFIPVRVAQDRRKESSRRSRKSDPR